VDDVIDSVAEERLSLSALLLTLADGDQGQISIDEIIEHFGRRAFGAVLFVFAIPNLLPLPPGSSTLLGFPLLLIAPQLAFGAREPWIPAAVRRQRIDRATLGRVCRRAAPSVLKAERMTTRRLAFMFGRLGDVSIGVVCTLLAAVLILPIPLGNLLPAIAIAALALSLVQRDGLLTIIGYLVAAVSAGVLVVSGQIVLGAIDRLGAMTGLW
jgi:hypothetical protein